MMGCRRMPTCMWRFECCVWLRHETALWGGGRWLATTQEHWVCVRCQEQSQGEYEFSCDTSSSHDGGCRQLGMRLPPPTGLMTRRAQAYDSEQGQPGRQAGWVCVRWESRRMPLSGGRGWILGLCLIADCLIGLSIWDCTSPCLGFWWPFVHVLAKDAAPLGARTVLSDQARGDLMGGGGWLEIMRSEASCARRHEHLCSTS